MQLHDIKRLKIFKMDDKILAIINQITKKRKEQKKAPFIALSPEVFRETNCSMGQYRLEINQLVKKGNIKYGQTLNHVYFTIEKS